MCYLYELCFDYKKLVIYDCVNCCFFWQNSLLQDIPVKEVENTICNTLVAINICNSLVIDNICNNKVVDDMLSCRKY